MQKIYLDDISPGTIIAKDIYNSYGTMLVSKGTVVMDRFIKQLEDIGINELYVEENSGEDFILMEEDSANFPLMT